MVCVLCVACLQLRESKKDRCVNLELPVGTNKSLDICCSAMRVNCSRFVSSIFTFKGRYFCSMEEWESKLERWGNARSRHFALSTLNKLSISCITDVVCFSTARAWGILWNCREAVIFGKKLSELVGSLAITDRHLVCGKAHSWKSRPSYSPVTLSYMIRGKLWEAQISLVYI